MLGRGCMLGPIFLKVTGTAYFVASFDPCNHLWINLDVTIAKKKNQAGKILGLFSSCSGQWSGQIWLVRSPEQRAVATCPAILPHWVRPSQIVCYWVLELRPYIHEYHWRKHNLEGRGSIIFFSQVWQGCYLGTQMCPQLYLRGSSFHELQRKGENFHVLGSICRVGILRAYWRCSNFLRTACRRSLCLLYQRISLGSPKNQKQKMSFICFVRFSDSFDVCLKL